jgi:hypothetical protein
MSWKGVVRAFQNGVEMAAALLAPLVVVFCFIAAFISLIVTVSK